MAKSPMEWVALAGIGFLVGVLSGFFGIGGGVVMVPALALLFQMDMAAATGTSLAAMAPAALAGAAKSSGLGHVHWPTAGIIAAFAMLGTYLVGVPLVHVMQKYYSQVVLQRLFGIFLLVVALRMMGVFDWLWHRIGR